MSLTQVTNISYWSKIKNAFGSVIFWFILFFGSFAVLFRNEWTQDMSEIAINATETESWDVMTWWDFVDYYGNVTTTENLWDNYIKPWNYIALSRTVEMYAWHEISETESEDKLWWWTQQTTTFDYEMERTSSPDKSSKFQEKVWHFNPSMSIKSDSFLVKNAKIDNYNLKVNKLNLPWYETLQLNNDILKNGNKVVKEGENGKKEKQKDIINTWSQSHTWLKDTKSDVSDVFNDPRVAEKKDVKEEKEVIKEEVNNMQVTDSEYLFSWKWSLQDPKIGDIRISYSVVRPNQEGTVFGIVKWSTITSYMDKEWNQLYRLFRWTKAEAVAQMHDEYTTRLWIFRIVGIVMMWIWLQMILSLIPTLASVIPFLWNLTWWIIKVATFFIALILWVVTIIVSMVIHNIIALVIVLVVVVWAWIYFWMNRDKEVEGKKIESEKVEIKKMEKTETVKETTKKPETVEKSTEDGDRVKFG